jgi:hypothetical protein
MSRRQSRKIKNLTLVTGLFLLGLVGVIFLVDLPKNSANTARASEITLSPISTVEILTEQEEALLKERIVYLDPDLSDILISSININKEQYDQAEIRLTQLFVDQKLNLTELNFAIEILEKKYNSEILLPEVTNTEASSQEANDQSI